MNPLSLTLALGHYDHTRDVTDGTVPVEGVALRTLHLPIEEIFYRFTLHREWDISEMSMGKYIALRAQDDPTVWALPIFISRAFRHSMFYVRDGGSVKRPEDLVGKTIGVPEWAQTAGIYGRGWLSDYLGIDLTRIRWVQAGVNQAGRKEKVALHLPDGLSYTPVPDKSLDQMLMDGEIDAVMSARPPTSLGKGLSRLMDNYQELEEQYFKETSIFPIMHGLVLRGDVMSAHPWVAMNLVKSFALAKKNSIERLSDVTASHAPLAWLPDYTSRMEKVFGEDWFPYGVDNSQGGSINRATLAAFCKFGFEQGICARRLAVDELFPKNVAGSFKV
ncbi:4,5-dihydroxyphthalate decarboxylase [Rhodoferax koreense]|uniref:4,5-dihydroxyphthalate decarboxylase n=1 Tax=Rhodoferax koreensis TaxID=1842727 RepID=A0A1P8JYK1_9BURK|nr:4,5-dihydroxyphthalate decarboxylase [Rhodoferax koreense]APW38833.1 4,5-dihydroxyphthalate decarboxylase [Rhodoferax koreense]